MNAEDGGADSRGAEGREELCPPTQWSVVRHASIRSGRGEEAAEKLCRMYWEPLYEFARRWGIPAADAEDLVQGFLADLLRRDALAAADPSRGRFRNFLLRAFRNYRGMQVRALQAGKRGGGAVCSLEEMVDDGGRGAEPVLAETPAELLDRELARRLLQQAVEAVRRDYVNAGKGPLFEGLWPHLWQTSDGTSKASLARRLRTSEGALNVAVHRLRKRVARRFRRELAASLIHSERIDEELRALLAALSTGSTAGKA